MKIMQILISILTTFKSQKLEHGPNISLQKPGIESCNGLFYVDSMLPTHTSPKEEYSI